MNNDIKTKVLQDPLLIKLLENIQDKNEKEKTVKVIEGFLEELQGKANSLTSAYQAIKNKQENS
jgi:hypothetical protein